MAKMKPDHISLEKDGSVLLRNGQGDEFQSFVFEQADVDMVIDKLRKLQGDWALAVRLRVGKPNGRRLPLRGQARAVTMGEEARRMAMTLHTQPLTDVHVDLIGEDGNAFAIMGRVSKALKRAGHKDLADEYFTEATSGDYDHLLQTTMKYVHTS